VIDHRRRQTYYPTCHNEFHAMFQSRDLSRVEFQAKKSTISSKEIPVSSKEMVDF
jgi:hypothetical protein